MEPMEPLKHDPPSSQPGPIQPQHHVALLAPSHSQPQLVPDNNNSSFDFQNGTRKRRRRRRDNNSNNIPQQAFEQPLLIASSSPSSPPLPPQPQPTLAHSNSTGDLTTTTDNTINKPLTSPQLLPNHSTKTGRQAVPSNLIQQSPEVTLVLLSSQSLNSIDEQTAASSHPLKRVADSFPSSSRPGEYESSSPNEKIPKSSFRRTSSTRSALSLVFDISQNRTISPSGSFSSRSESRQGRFHADCLPVDDPMLKIENKGRIRSAQGGRRTKSSTSARPGSDVSLLGRRESITNVIYAGPSTVDGEDCERESVYWKKLQLQSGSHSSLLFSRMATSLRGQDVTPGEFDVVVDEDYSPSRPPRGVTTPTTSDSSLPSCPRTGFLYQVTDFDRLTKDVPVFVKNYTQKCGRMATETFILRLNYLRRRRQLGEVSSTINISSSSSNSNINHHHNNSTGHSQNNLHTASKRSSPATT